MTRSTFKLSLLSTAAINLSLLGAVGGAVLLPSAAEAQTITSTIRGTVISPSGEPVSGATVTIRDTRTGRQLTAQTGNGGGFGFRGLDVGGPYTVTVTGTAFQDQVVEGISLNTASRTNVDITLQSTEVETLVVTGVRQTTVSELAIGPSSTFTRAELQGLPSIDRDFRDIIRLDPRVQIDPTNNDSISCAGGDFRGNTFTVDGVQLTDPFGLEDSGFPSENTQPIAFRAAREVSVEFAPFDVEYGGFTGCAINIITETGTNEFHGEAFGQFTSDGLTGGTLTLEDGTEISVPADFNNYRWGASLGGPIIKDKLFFFAAYEEVDQANPINDAPDGNGGINNFDFATVDLANQVAGIVQDTFGFPTGTFGTDTTLDNRRILARLDWFITDRHQLAFTYNREREENVEPDSLTGNFGTFAFLENFENEGTESDIFSGRLFSQWTDNLSTEVRYSHTTVSDIQNPVGGGEAQDANPIPQINVGFGNDDEVILGAGPGIFRSANELENTIQRAAFITDWSVDSGIGRHNFKFGYEFDNVETFNLFIINATGRLNFASIEDLAAGTPTTGNVTPFFPNNDVDELIAGNTAGFFGNGCVTGNAPDCAAQFDRTIHTFYIQDEWEPIPALTITAGLRYDFYQSDDVPALSTVFTERFGFDNTTGFDDLEIFLPRFGFNYDAPWNFFGQTSFRGGAGVFSGGDPTVFFSNAFSNSGNLIGFGSTGNAACAGFDVNSLVGPNGFTGVPECVLLQQQAEAALGQGRIDASDPNLEIPSIIRANFGFDHFTDFNGWAGGFFDDWQFQLDLIHTRDRNAFDTIDISLAQNVNEGLNGFTASGRPIFDNIDPLIEGCNAVFEGPGNGFSNVTDVCFDSSQFIGQVPETALLTNVDGGSSISFSTQLRKQFDYDVFNKPSTFDFNFGYAYLDVTEVAAMSSSTSGSNLDGTETVNVLDKPVTRAAGNTHNITFAPQWSIEFAEGWRSRIGLFFQARSGNRFSFVFDDGDDANISIDGDQALFEVPTGPDDPNFDFSALSDDELTQLFDFINAQGLNEFAGGVAPRNGFQGDWNFTLDLRLQQEIPTYYRESRLTAFVDIQNLPNLISNDAGIFSNPASRQEVISLDAIDDQGRYVVSGLDLDEPDEISIGASLWQVQVGVRFEF